jgi:hypothetical protein
LKVHGKKKKKKTEKEPRLWLSLFLGIAFGAGTYLVVVKTL